MFDSAELDHRVSKEEYRREEPKLREALLAAQFELKDDPRFPVLILIAGVEGAGKSETINTLAEWMDPRFLEVSGFRMPTEEEAAHPPMWRFWRALPPKGRIGVFFGAWHTAPILERVAGRIGRGAFEAAEAEIMRLERMLVDEGVLLLKYWFHLSKPQQKKRLKALEKDPATAWRVTKRDWDYYDRHEEFVAVCEPFLRRTSTGHAPWVVVPGADARYRTLFVGRHLLAALRARLDAPPAPKPVPVPPPLPGKVNILRALDLSQSLSEKQYEEELPRLQGRLAQLCRDRKFARTALIAVFEGNDAAGKGGAVRRVAAALDARSYRIVPIAAPTEEERAQPYLWRFWRHVPRPGSVVIFDRSWYGRVLVERVEGFCAPADWQRAYAEINDFEASLLRHGAGLAKFWLAISKAEQLKRFRARETTPFKRFKITEEDWRNRKRWDAYEAAVCDMVDRTSTAEAPWTIVEANDKRFARVKVLRTLVETVERALDR
jgi:polyphosphate:AMP phosphotransferase